MRDSNCYYNSSQYINNVKCVLENFIYTNIIVRVNVPYSEMIHHLAFLMNVNLSVKLGVVLDTFN